MNEQVKKTYAEDKQVLVRQAPANLKNARSTPKIINLVDS
jgi:hypothetical protein